MIISAGQEVIITTENSKKTLFDSFGLQPNPRLILNSDIAISLSSSFTPSLGGLDVSKGISGFFSSITALNDFMGSGSFKQMGLQTWQSTEPIGLNLELKLVMQTNAQWDVYEPALALMKLPLPTLVGSGIGGLKPPGPTIYGAIADTVFDATKGKVDPGTMGGTFNRGHIYGVYIGKSISLPQVVIKRVSPVFSIKTDINDYPIWCTLSMDIDSIYTATQENINDFRIGRTI